MSYPPCQACGSTQGPEHLCPGLSAQMVGKVLDGRYEIQAVLGQGGMGMVFEAEQTSVRRPVAVKTLHPALASAPQFFERFRREAEVASRLRHPNIITIFDFGRTADGICYYVMELLQGESLKQIVKRDGPMSLRRAVNIIEQAARGLAHAHNQNVVHRDVKPHNITVQNLDGQDFVKVLDFGLVKALEADDDAEQLTSTGQVLGTPQYMPPEQAGGETVDHRSDLYSLAGVFYYCLTGTSPFQANTVRKALNAALTRTVSPVATYRSGAVVPRELDEFFRKALARDKEDRYQSAEEFIAEMKAAIARASDAELDALPTTAAGERKDAGSGSHSGQNGRAGKRKGSGAGSGPSKRAPSNVIVDPALGGKTISAASRRTTAGEIPSQKGQAPTLPSEVAPRQSGRRVALFAVPLAVFAIGGGVVWKLTSADAPRSAEVAAPSKPMVQEPPKPPPPAPAEPAEVKVTLTSNPPGASVFDASGVLLGTTPLERTWAKDQLHTVRLELSGYITKSLPFRVSSDQVLNVDLEPEPAAKPTRPKKKRDDIPVFE